MPGGDRTGPIGAGAKTGRALGLCVGNDTPDYAFGRGGGFGRNVGFGGRGGGFGRSVGFGGRGGGFGGGGGGRGRRNRFFATGTPGYARYNRGITQVDAEPINEAEALRNYAEVLAQELEYIKEKLDVLESNAETQNE